MKILLLSHENRVPIALMFFPAPMFIVRTIISSNSLESSIHIFAKMDNATFIFNSKETVKDVQVYTDVGLNALASEHIYSLLCNKYADEMNVLVTQHVVI